jgi:putative two-component system response regulator
MPMSITFAEPAAGTKPSIDDTEAILLALAETVEQRDRNTAGHCERMAFIGVSLGIAMGLSRAELLSLYRGGFLHDIGKVGIPDSILFKPGSLTAEEWAVMRTHTTRGEEICRHLPSLAPVLPIIRHHHERWDGSGYPDNLRGSRIPLLARIMQIADIYDALISPRPYKGASTPQEALEIIAQETAGGWRDPEVVEVFSRMHSTVIMRVAEYTSSSDCSLEAMRSVLSGLHLS